MKKMRQKRFFLCLFPYASPSHIKIRKVFCAFISFFVIASAIPLPVLADGTVITEMDNAFVSQAVNTILGKNVDGEPLQAESTNHITGNINQVGIFNAPSDMGIPFHSGIVLATGNVSNLFSNPGVPSGPNTPGYQPLNDILGANETRDAIAIEFTIKTDSSHLSFEYFFASNEYNHGAKFNDIFALWIVESNENIAILPYGTFAGQAVTVNNTRPVPGNSTIVNIPGEYYIPVNGKKVNNYWFPFLGHTPSFVADATGLFTAGDDVTIRMAIANVGDNSVSSAVFIRANSVTTTTSTDDEYRLWYSAETGGYISTVTITASDDVIPEEYKTDLADEEYDDDETDDIEEEDEDEEDGDEEDDDEDRDDEDEDEDEDKEDKEDEDEDDTDSLEDESNGNDNSETANDTNEIDETETDNTDSGNLMPDEDTDLLIEDNKDSDTFTEPIPLGGATDIDFGDAVPEDGADSLADESYEDSSVTDSDNASDTAPDVNEEDFQKEEKDVETTLTTTPFDDLVKISSGDVVPENALVRLTADVYEGSSFIGWHVISAHDVDLLPSATDKSISFHMPPSDVRIVARFSNPSHPIDIPPETSRGNIRPVAQTRRQEETAAEPTPEPTPVAEPLPTPPNPAPTLASPLPFEPLTLPAATVPIEEDDYQSFGGIPQTGLPSLVTVSVTAIICLLAAALLWFTAFRLVRKRVGDAS